jgi:probable phosphoglycerate mutase
MKILLIRHGDPNYKDNALTPLGHLQAEALADRLQRRGTRFSAIYASEYGRAIETAEHVAVRLGMDLQRLGFIHEISYGPHGSSGEEKIRHSPWKAPKMLIENDVATSKFDPRDWWAYKGTRLEEADARVCNGFDGWLAENCGFVREGTRYICERENKDEILMFCHGGTISCLIGHFMNIGVIGACATFRLFPTSITTVEFRSDPGAPVLPLLRGVGDFAHCENIVYKDPEEGSFAAE